MSTLRVIVTEGWDVWKNFAIEEYMVRNVKEDECILYLWQSKKNVMLGKNQNPWRECNTKLLEAEGGKLSRRITGGGAIYSDRGNMLFSFIIPRKKYDVKRQLGVILNSCKKMGIYAQMSGRNDLTVNGKKFSGNAFFLNSRVGLHHGSLLINEDVESLVRYLTPSIEKITSKGIASVRSRVTNLSEYNEDITIDSFKEVIVESFIEEYKKENMEVKIEKDPEWFENDVIQTIYKKNASWEWCYGKSAESDVVLETRFDWGEIQMHIKMRKSIIDDIVVYSDGLDQEFIEQMPAVFMNKKFQPKHLAESIGVLGTTQSRREMCEDIAEWIRSEQFVSRKDSCG